MVDFQALEQISVLVAVYGWHRILGIRYAKYPVAVLPLAFGGDSFPEPGRCGDGFVTRGKNFYIVAPIRNFESLAHQFVSRRAMRGHSSQALHLAWIAEKTWQHL